MDNASVDAVAIPEVYSTTWRSRGDGIYERVSTGVLYERPKLGGTWTYRSLGTKNFKNARNVRRDRNRERADTDRATITVGEILRRYARAGYPHSNGTARSAGERKGQEHRCGDLLEFWDKAPLATITSLLCDDYCEWRLKSVRRGPGLRTVDQDLSTLRLALRLGAELGLVRRMPLADGWPQYARHDGAHRSNATAPHDAEDLHKAAKLLLDDGSLESEAAGWQMLLEAITGLSTTEALALRDDAAPKQPGWVTPEGKIYRGGPINPYTVVHEGLSVLLPALRRWKVLRIPDSPWYFPSRRASVDGSSAPLRATALVVALASRTAPVLKRRLTSQGLRAFYVRVRRSYGIADARIAWELGLAPGSGLERTYGGTPPHWREGAGPCLLWLPKGRPAWADLLDRLENVALNIQ